MDPRRVVTKDMEIDVMMQQSFGRLHLSGNGNGPSSEEGTSNDIQSSSYNSQSAQTSNAVCPPPANLQIEPLGNTNQVETRSPQQIIFDKFVFHVTMYTLNKTNLEYYQENEITEVFIPFRRLMSGYPEIVCDVGYLRDLFMSEKYDVRVNDDGEYGVRLVIEDWVRQREEIVEWEKEREELLRSDFDEEMEDEPSDARNVRVPAWKADEKWD